MVVEGNFTVRYESGQTNPTTIGSVRKLTTAIQSSIELSLFLLSRALRLKSFNELTFFTVRVHTVLDCTSRIFILCLDIGASVPFVVANNNLLDK